MPPWIISPIGGRIAWVKPFSGRLKEDRLGPRKPRFLPDPTSPDFDLAQHKGSYVFVAFDGFPWCGPCKLELPHLLALAQEYANNPSVPAVHFVIVNDRFTSSLSAVETFAKQEIVTIPVIDDDAAKIQQAYSGFSYSLVPQCYVVKPNGDLCDVSLQDTRQRMTFRRGKGVQTVDWGAQPPPIVALIPAYAGWPPEFATPVRGPPQPWPKGLSLMSWQIMRALAIRDSAAGLDDHETSSAVRGAALRSAAQDLRRMEKASALIAELGPLAPHAAVAPRDRR